VARPVTHGVRQLARQLAVVKAPDGAVPVPLDLRTRRALNRLQRDLDVKTAETIRDGLVDGISCGTILYQKALRELLTSPDLRKEQGLAKFTYWLGNHLDRQRDQLLQLESQRAAKAVPKLEDYLAARSTPAPPPSAATTINANGVGGPADAAGGVVGSEASE
jgi:hypothetical protein